MIVIQILNKIGRLGLLLAVVFSSIASAEPSTIELSKGDKTIIVFGTIHVTHQDWPTLPTAAMRSLVESDALAVELDISDKKTIIEINKFIMTSGVSSGKKITDILDEKNINKLNELLGPMAIGVMNMRPWLAALTVAQLRMTKAGYSGEGVDMTLIKIMKKKQKPVISLETVTEQLSIFSNIAHEEEKVFLESVLVEDSLFNEEMNLTVSIWKNHDEKSSKKLLTKMKLEMPKLYQKLLIDRNHVLVRRSIELNDKYPRLFMAVGAAHLFGEEGVLNLLKKSGYTKIGH